MRNIHLSFQFELDIQNVSIETLHLKYKTARVSCVFNKYK